MSQFEVSRRLMGARIFGGGTQKERMIADKRKTLDRVTLYSYQGDNIKKINEDKTVKGLINPNVLKQDYDDKILSIRYEHGFAIGDVFEWVDTKTHWLIYLQDITELAYFRGDIRRCWYQIFWKNESGEQKSTYAAVRGPVETDISYVQKENTKMDVPSYSLHILIPANEDTIAYFKRYAKFYLPQANSETKKVCWQVEVVNSISTPGILEIDAEEYYSNVFLDDIANGIVDGLVTPPIDPTPKTDIIGETFIKAKIPYIYEYNGNEQDHEWVYNKKLPVKVLEKKGKTIKLMWESNYRGSFDLSYGSSVKTIVVDSLF